MSDYVGRDGWHIGRPVREISDDYVRREFLGHARQLLTELRTYRRPQLIREKIPVKEEDRTHHSQAKIVNTTEEYEKNPSWYVDLHNSPEYLVPRKGRFRRQAKYVGTKGEDYRNPKIPNKSSRFHEMYKSLIERPRITKALEEITLNQDEELRVYSRVAQRVSIVDGKRVRARLKTPYQRGNYVTIMRKFITERLLFGYIPEAAKERPDWEAPGDDKVRAYFGMISFAEEQRQRGYYYEVDEKEPEPKVPELNPSNLVQREPGEDLDEPFSEKDSTSTQEKQDDDIPF